MSWCLWVLVSFSTGVLVGVLVVLVSWCLGVMGSFSIGVLVSWCLGVPVCIVSPLQ